MKEILATGKELDMLAELELKAREVMAQVGIVTPTVHFGIHSSIRVMAECHFNGSRANKITVSRQYLKAMYNTNFEDCVGSIIHELTHAYCGPYVGHTGEWKRIANYISRKTPYNIERCLSERATEDFKENCKKQGIKTFKTIEKKYKIVCKNCGHNWEYTRKTKLLQKIENGYKGAYCPYCKGKEFKVENLL